MQTDSSGATAARERRQLIAVYETYDRACSARDELTGAGIPADDIEILDTKEGGWPEEGDGVSRSEGFWGAMKRLFSSGGGHPPMPRGCGVATDAGVRPRPDIARASRRGAGTHRAALDFDARVSDWRNEGWSGR